MRYNTPDFGFLALTGIHEPSAIQQLPDGRFLVVEDEKQHPFSLVTISPDGSVSSTPLNPGLLEADDAFWKLDDLEGIASDRSGYIYAITSHSRDGDGDEKKSRDKLGRFRIEGDSVVEPMLARGLKSALVQRSLCWALQPRYETSKPAVGSISRHWRSAQTSRVC